MADPRFYPDGPDRVDVLETHISWVFLAGERAFKLRKQVVFPFLDYATPDRRRQMCEEELRLGRRLAPALYLGVRAVVARRRRLRARGGGPRTRLRARGRDAPVRRVTHARLSAADGRCLAGRRADGGPSHCRVPLDCPPRTARQLRAIRGGRDGQRELHHTARLRRPDRRPAAGSGPPFRGRVPARAPRGARGSAHGGVHTRVPRRPACRARRVRRRRGGRSSTPWSSIPSCGRSTWPPTSHSS